MSMLLVAGIGAYAIYKHKKKEEKRRRVDLIMNGDQQGQEREQTLTGTHVSELEQLQTTCQINDMVQKRIILASLIRGMYKRKQETANCSQYWESHHYELVSLQSILTEDELVGLQHYLEKEEKHKYFGVLHKKNTAAASPLAPEWVVAIRGTNILSLHDLGEDIKISLERLHTSSTVKLIKVVIARLFVKFKMDFAKRCKVVVTGHSLGASNAMLVARGFALKGYPLDTHLFNPPFATLNALARKWTRKFFSPILGKAKVDKIKDKLCRIEMGISMTFNQILDGGQRMRKQYADYKALAKWSPYLYLNEDDPICEMYISHFTKRMVRKAKLHENISTWYSLGSALLKATLGDAETFHLMPRAVCCIAQTNGYGPLSAHSLDIWTRHDVPITVKVPNLVVEVNDETKQLTLKVACDGTEDDLVEGGDKAAVAAEKEEWIPEGDWFKEVDDDHDH